MKAPEPYASKKYVVKLEESHAALLEAAKDAYQILKDQYMPGEVQEKLKTAIDLAEGKLL